MTDRKKKSPSAKKKADKISKDAKAATKKKVKAVQACPPQEATCQYCSEQTIGWSFDREVYKDLRVSIRADYPHIGEDFEILQPGGDFEATNPARQDFNCFAYSLGITDRQVILENRDGEKMRGYVVLANLEPIKSVEVIYTAHGYSRLKDLDLSYQPGTTKIAVYTETVPNPRLLRDQVDVEHLAIQLPIHKGAWSSKLGPGNPLILHRCTCKLEGDKSGTVTQVWSRSGPAPAETAEAMRMLLGS